MYAYWRKVLNCRLSRVLPFQLRQCRSRRRLRRICFQSTHPSVRRSLTCVPQFQHLQRYMALFKLSELIVLPHAPDMYASAAQQQINHWEWIVHYSFPGTGANYMRSLTLCTTLQRPNQINDNVVFLYDPALQLTPDYPFPSICNITHIWYRLTESQGVLHYFDIVGVLCKLVSSALLPPKIRLQYEGTYLLLSPSTLPRRAQGNQPPPSAPNGNSSLMAAASAALH